MDGVIFNSVDEFLTLDIDDKRRKRFISFLKTLSDGDDYPDITSKESIEHFLRNKITGLYLA